MTKKPIQQSKKIGIVGVGDMGGDIANNFIKKGYQIFICDLNKRLVKKFEDKGAIVCSSPKEVAQKADFIFEVTPNDDSSKKVWTAENGILQGATSNKILAVCSTISAGWVDELAKKCEKAGFHFFDIAINGGDKGLTLLVGGDKTLLKEIKPVLLATAARIVYFGPSGQAMRYKLILNFLQAVHMVGFSQAMKIAKYHNMNLKKVGASLVRRPGGALTDLAWQFYQAEDDDVLFKVELIAKDLGYAKKLAEQLNVSLLDDVLAEYKSLVKNGHGKKDWYKILTLE